MSDTVKLIIEIDPHIIYAIQNNKGVTLGNQIDICNAIKNGKPSSENKGEWIPVSERLPEEKQAVLVWCPEYKNIYCAYCANGNWWIFGAFSQINPNAVIAWRPLPEPYKAEEGGE